MHIVLLGQSVCTFSCCEFIEMVIHVSVFFYSLHFHSSASWQGNTLDAFIQSSVIYIIVIGLLIHESK